MKKSKRIKRYNKLRILSLLLFLIGSFMILFLPLFTLDIDKIKFTLSSSINKNNLFIVKLMNKLESLGWVSIAGNRYEVSPDIGVIKFSVFDQYKLSIEGLIKDFSVDYLIIGAAVYFSSIIVTLIALIKALHFNKKRETTEIVFYHTDKSMFFYSISSFIIAWFINIIYIFVSINASYCHTFFSAIKGVTIYVYISIFIILLSFLTVLVNRKNKKIIASYRKAPISEIKAEDLSTDKKEPNGNINKEITDSKEDEREITTRKSISYIKELIILLAGIFLVIFPKTAMGFLMTSEGPWKYISIICGIVCITNFVIYVISVIVRRVKSGLSIYQSVVSSINCMVKPIIAVCVVFAILYMFFVPWGFVREKSLLNENEDTIAMINPITNKGYYFTVTKAIEKSSGDNEKVVVHYTTKMKARSEVVSEKNTENGQTTYFLSDVMVIVDSEQLEYNIIDALKYFINGYLIGEKFYGFE